MKYLLLPIIAITSYFAACERPIALAAWVSTLLLVRFLRDTSGLRGYLLSIPTLLVPTTFALQGMMPMPVGMRAVILFFGVAIGLLPFVADRLVRRKLGPVAASLVLPASAVALEFLFTRGDTGTWGSVAYSQSSLPLLQLVSVSGIWGITFIIHWFATVANLAWEERASLREARPALAAFALAFAVVSLGGTIRMIVDGSSDATIRAAAVLPDSRTRNASIRAAFGSEARTQTAEDRSAAIRAVSKPAIDELVAKTEREAVAGAELVAWSEAAVFVDVADEVGLVERLQQLADDHHVWIVAAIASVDVSREKPLENKVVMIDSEGRVAWSQRKNRPVTVAGEDRFTLPGDGRMQIANASFARVASAICYDLDFPSLIRQASTNEASLLIGPSNDWEGVGHTHSRMARLRGIENGVAMLRPASNGISAAFDSLGREIGHVDDLASRNATLVVQLPVSRRQTIYGRFGDWFAFGSMAGLVLLVALAFRGRYSGRSVSVSVVHEAVENG